MKNNHFIIKSISVLLTFSMLVMNGITALADVTLNPTSWAELSEELQNDANIKLMQDIVATDEDTFITIPEGKTVSLDLNGYKIDRNLTEAKDDGYIFDNFGNFTLSDSSNSKTGTLTGGNSNKICCIRNEENATMNIDSANITENNLGIAVMNFGKLNISKINAYNNDSSTILGNNGGTLNIDDCNVSNNTILYALIINKYNSNIRKEAKTTINNCTISNNTINGAIGLIENISGTFILNNGIINNNNIISNVELTSFSAGTILNIEGNFTMNDGIIKNNTAKYGGGVFNYAGNFTMNGGTITGNTAEYGGGVYTCDGSEKSSFTMNGGTISNNTATINGGGFFCGYPNFETNDNSTPTPKHNNKYKWWKNH